MDFDYPNDGASFDDYRPTDQEIEERQDEEKVYQSYPILNDLIEEFENDIKEADSVMSLGVDSGMPTLQVQIIIEGNSKYIQKMQDKLSKLKEFKERYKLG